MKINRLVRGASLVIAAIGLAVTGQSQTFLTNGLVAYYPFNGNANDASGNGNNGTNMNVAFVTNRFGQPGQAVSYAAGEAFSEVPSLYGMPYVPVTYSIWFNLNSYLAQTDFGLMTLLGRESGGYNGEGALCLYNDYRTGITANEIIYMTGGAIRSYRIPDTNRWTHLVFTFDNSRLASFYFDGQLAHSEVYTLAQNAVLPFRIGASAAWQPGSGRKSWGGSIDDVRIYNRALSSNEVAQLYAIESAPIVKFVKAFTLDYDQLKVGTNYQLQASSDMNTWTNWGAPFTAATTSYTNSNYQRIDDWGKLFFRLLVAP